MKKNLTTIEKMQILFAVIIFIAAFSIYLFPWFVPFIWELPTGMTAPYYGILIAIEVSPIAQRWRENVQEDTDDEE